jgi:cytidylate kinase
MPTIESIIDRQLRRWEAEKTIRAGDRREKPSGPLLQHVITVSRQRGSGGSIVAERVAQRFDYTLLHRDIIDRICSSTGTVRRIVASLDEHVKPEVTIWFESMLGMKYMNAGDYVKLLLETIDSIARLGGVVVVGRGANLIIGPERGFHVRVVAPRDVRVRRLMERDGKSERDATRDVDGKDRERADFIRKVYGREIDDPQGYDLVINTGLLTIDAVTSLVANAAMEKFERLREAGQKQPAHR